MPGKQRFGSGSLLGPVTPLPPVDDDPESAPAPTPAPATAAAAATGLEGGEQAAASRDEAVEDRPRRRTRRPATPEPATVEEPRRRPRPTSTRIPASLFQRINAERAETGVTHEMWFLDAAERVQAEVARHYRLDETQPDTVWPQRRRRARRPPGGEVLAQYALHLTDEEKAPLLALHARVTPVSLSDLVTTIVALALAQRPDST